MEIKCKVCDGTGRADVYTTEEGFDFYECEYCDDGKIDVDISVDDAIAVLKEKTPCTGCHHNIRSDVFCRKCIFDGNTANLFDPISDIKAICAQPDNNKDIVLWQGEAKVGEPDFSILKGRGNNETVCLVPVPYKLIKGQKGQIIFRKQEAKP